MAGDTMVPDDDIRAATDLSRWADYYEAFAKQLRVDAAELLKKSEEPVTQQQLVGKERMQLPPLLRRC
jgi:hypothetical protein